ncbi:MAG TPA: iron-containing alcohol dehydrogenase, partial [Anaerolineales bacterium]|nr:iron-containing alcohol dehydrogenase [Anaerolineales bacterium]
YLPRAVEDGSDMEARERMHNAATCAGLGFGNSMASIAHAMGHVLGAVFHVPHGRAVGLFLPYTVEFAAREAPDRFAELARLLGLTDEEGEPAARALAQGLRDLIRRVGNPLSLAEAGIDRESFDGQLDKLVDDAFNDTQMVTVARPPSYDELRRLFVYAYEGREIDF